MTPDKELQYQARIGKLREALDRVVICHSDYCERRLGVSDHSYELARIAEQALSRPDDLSALEAYVREEKRKVLVRAMAACHFEKVNYDDTKYPEDKVYNQAIDDCIEVIEKLVEELK